MTHTPTRNNRLTLGRVVLYLLLILFAVYYIVPLYVTLSTSFKSLDEIRSGNLLALPHVWQFDSWSKAWSSACTGVTCDGMQPFFWNSIKMVIPAVLISTFLGAFNGYVFAHWRFRGSEILFAALLVGCFIPFQVVILPMARLLGEVRPGQYHHGPGLRARGVRHGVHDPVLP